MILSVSRLLPDTQPRPEQQPGGDWLQLETNSRQDSTSTNQISGQEKGQPQNYQAMDV